jgi:predicted Zn-dependent protease
MLSLLVTFENYDNYSSFINNTRMKSMFTRIGFLTTAVLVLVSCGGDPNIESAKLNLSRRDYGKALESADAAIAMTPTSPLAHYYRGYILLEQGKRETIPNRATFYQQADSAFTTSENLYLSQPEQGSEYQLIEVHRTNTWVEEYNASIAVLNANPDEDLTDVQYDQSIAHLNNAYAIQPDSLNTLEILGEVYLMKGDNDAALATFQRAINSEGEQTAYRYQRIGQLHIQNKSFEEAETILKTGIELFPASVELVQELADLYIQSNKSSQAIEVLGELVDRDPENAQYRLVYGIQIYSITQTHADELRNTYTSIEDLNRTIREEERKSRPNRELLAQYRETLSGFTADAVAAETQIEDLTTRAEEQLKRSIELNDTNSFAYNALGTIYYNRGLAQFDKRNATSDNAAATAFDQQGRAFLEQSLPYNERAAELDGDNTDYWMFLFRVYTMLGMTEKALEAQQKAGL